MTRYYKLRRQGALDAKGNHAFLALDPKHNILVESNHDICYGRVTPDYLSQAEYIYIFFKPPSDDRLDRCMRWCAWVINDSQYKDAFITKDPLEGMHMGFELDTHADQAMMYGGMFVLRNGFEQLGWSWCDYVDMGFTPVESYALATHFTLSGGGLDRVFGFRDHFLIKQGSPFSAFEGKRYKPYNKTLSEGIDGNDWSLSTDHWGATDNYKTVPLPIGGADLKSSVSEALKSLKEL